MHIDRWLRALPGDRRTLTVVLASAVVAVLAAAAITGTVVVGAAQPGVRPLDLLGGAVIALVATLWGAHRAAPVWSTVAVGVVTAGYLLAGFPYGPIQLFVVLVCFELARRSPGRTTALACAAVTAVLAATLWTRLLETEEPATAVVVLVLWPAVFVVVPALCGALVRMRTAARARDREDLVAEGAYEERLRVAREVHDTAGHGFAVVAMQAGVALTVFDERPDQARTSLEAIRATSTQALRELHATLATVTTPDGTGAPDGDLTALVERTRAAGLPVELTIEGSPPHGTASAVASVVFRVVQESLTNVVRHAGRTTASVEVNYRPDAVTVVIADRGPGTPLPERSTGPGGRGLAGSRGRVEELGGTFTAADRPGGGFEVYTRIPVGGARR